MNDWNNRHDSQCSGLTTFTHPTLGTFGRAKIVLHVTSLVTCTYYEYIYSAKGDHDHA